jgi:hypothetical protein
MIKVDETLYVKSISSLLGKYLVRLNTKKELDDKVYREERINKARKELDKLASLIRRRNIKRESIAERISSIMKRFGVKRYLISL